jgi:hypothetical protein
MWKFVHDTYFGRAMAAQENSGFEALPWHAARWLETLLPAGLPLQTTSAVACPVCIEMSASEQFRHAAEIDNFLAGALLVNGDIASADARRELEERITAAVDVTPLGIGHAADAPCAPWLCNHATETLRCEFWSSVKLLMESSESVIAKWCALGLGISARSLECVRTGEYVSSEVLWGVWGGRKHAFFEASFRLAADLEWKNVVRIGGAHLAELAQHVVQSHSELQPRSVTVQEEA